MTVPTTDKEKADHHNLQLHDYRQRMQSEHTPGPWIHNVAGENHWIRAGDGRAIAFIGGKDGAFTIHKNTPHKANAKLVAAGPGLLAAASDLMEYLAFMTAISNPRYPFRPSREGERKLQAMAQAIAIAKTPE